MTILRFVDGRPVEITLSNGEMYEAFYEQRLKWDMSALLDIFEWSGDDDEDQKCLQNIQNSSELRKLVARQYRERVENDLTGEQELQYARAAYNSVVRQCE